MSNFSISALNCASEHLAYINEEDVEQTAASISSSDEVGITIPATAWCTVGCH